MATKVLSPTDVKFNIIPQLRLEKSIGRDLATNVVPYRLNVFDSPSYRIRKGWPVAVPPHDVHALGLVSCSGELLSERPDANDVTTQADVRWVADNSFNTDALAWFPQTSNFGGVTWKTAVEWLPTLVEDYTYSHNNHRFIKSAVNFDHDSSEHMWTNLTTIAGASGYSVVMVGTVNSVYGNSEGQSYTGIIGNGRSTPSAGLFAETIGSPWELRLISNALTLIVGTGRSSIDIADIMASNAPFIIIVVLNTPRSVLYVATSSKDIRSTEVSTGTETTTFSTELVLGRSFGDTLHTADMAVMDLGIYGKSLNTTQMLTEVATLATIYGGK